MRIEVLTTDDCPNAANAVRRVRQIAKRLAPDAELQERVVADAAQAQRLRFPGSPTVRVDGVDLEGRDVRTSGLACRRYADGSGLPPEWLVEAAILRRLEPRHLLFLCVANSARSQMAEAIAGTLAPAGVRISSAGSAPSKVNPLALRALAETGIDAAGQRSKGIDEIEDGVDAVITLCAEEVCPAYLGSAHRLHWPLPDPAQASGSDDERLRAFRAVRDELQTRLARLWPR